MGNGGKKRLAKFSKNEVELQNAFDLFARNNCAPFAQESRSIGRIKTSIYNIFDAWRDEDEWTKIQAAVLAPENQQIMIDTINLAKEMYLEEVGKVKKVGEKRGAVECAESHKLHTLFRKERLQKSVIQPYYTRKSGVGTADLFEEDSDLEVDFIEYLEKSKAVEWWFKNGTKDGSYFCRAAY